MFVLLVRYKGQNITTCGNTINYIGKKPKNCDNKVQHDVRGLI